MLLGWSAAAIANGQGPAMCTSCGGVVAHRRQDWLGIQHRRAGNPAPTRLGTVDASVVFAADFSSVSVQAVAYSGGVTEAFPNGATIVEGGGLVGPASAFVPSTP